jgi:ribosomal protein S18 acetylase RimI-like enzyme
MVLAPTTRTPARLRSLSSADLPAACELLRLNPTVAFQEWEVAPLAEHIVNQPDLCLVAESESGALVGVVVAGSLGVRGMVSHLAVEQASRRSGIASALVDATLAAFRRRGIHRVLLMTTPGNSCAERFWSSKGFLDTAPEKMFERDL